MVAMSCLNLIFFHCQLLSAAWCMWCRRMDMCTSRLVPRMTSQRARSVLVLSRCTWFHALAGLSTQERALWPNWIVAHSRVCSSYNSNGHDTMSDPTFMKPDQSVLQECSVVYIYICISLYIYRGLSLSDSISLVVRLYTWEVPWTLRNW